MDSVNESLLVRIDERVKVITESLVLDRQSRKEQYVRTEELGNLIARQGDQISTMNKRMTSFEEALTKQAPTIEEFITIKHKVVGAGRFGKWLWVVGVAIITAVYNFREAIGYFLIQK